MLKIISTMLIMTICCQISLAHGGGTDRAGGHYDRLTGEYHFHHGHGPHQHEFGICLLENYSPTISDESAHKHTSIRQHNHFHWAPFWNFVFAIFIGLGIGRVFQFFSNRK